MFTEESHNYAPLTIAVEAKEIPPQQAVAIVSALGFDSKRAIDLTDVEFEQLDAAISAAHQLPVNLTTAYTNFSAGGKAAFGTAYDTVINHVKRGDIDAAKLAIQMVAIPDEVPGVPAAELATWVAKKAEIIALFP